MALACVMASGHGATERLLAGVVARLKIDGVRVAGALRAASVAAGTGYCHSDLLLLPEGPLVRITQDLGPGSSACRMDAGALESAVGLATAQLEAGVSEIVVLNKFGLSEAEGRGFRALIGEALGRGLPVLTGLSETHRVAFERFSGGMATHLAADEDVIVSWCLNAAGRYLTTTDEV